MAADNDFPLVVGKLKKSRKSWAQLTRILGVEGAKPMVSGMFFKTVVQAVLFFGSETWVLISHMGRALGSFQREVARWITGGQPKIQEEVRWEYPPLAAAM